MQDYDKTSKFINSISTPSNIAHIYVNNYTLLYIITSVNSAEITCQLCLIHSLHTYTYAMIWAKGIPVSCRHLRICHVLVIPVIGEWTSMDMDDWHPVVDLGIYRRNDRAVSKESEVVLAAWPDVLTV